MTIALWVAVGFLLLVTFGQSRRIRQMESRMERYPCYQDFLPPEDSKPKHRSMLDGLRPDGTRERN